MLSENSYYVKGPDAKRYFSGVADLHSNYVNDDECFARPLVSQKSIKLSLRTI